MESTKSIDELRTEYKEKINIAFNKFTTSQIFEKCINSLKLNRYYFRIATRKYESELLDLVCKQLSKSGKAEDAIVFDVKPGDVYLSESMIIDKLINEGRMLMILDENDKVAACCGIFDYADPMEFDESHKNKIIKSLPTNYAHFIELAADFTEKSKSFVNFETEYGKCILPKTGITRPELSRKGLHFIMLIICTAIAKECGYKYLCGIVSSSTQIRKMRTFGIKTYYKMKYDKYKFNDGIDMKYYYNNLINKYNYNQQQLNELKKELMIGAYSVPLVRSIESGAELTLKLFLAARNKKNKSKL